MNALGIDVFKGKSMVAVMRPCGEAALAPFEVSHTGSELSELAKTLKSLPGETRVVMEYTGYYHAPIALALCEAGLYVSIVNTLLVHDYGNDSLRRAKTDKKDAVKLANYALDRWNKLPKYQPQEDTRLLLKTTHRQYQQTSKILTMQKNNLITLLEITFPNANSLFSSPMREDGSEGMVQEAWLPLQRTESRGGLCRRPLPRLRAAKNGRNQTADRAGSRPDSRFLQSVGFAGQADAEIGGSPAGISCRHGDVRRGASPWSPTYGGDWRCSPLPFQIRSRGLRGR